MFDPVAVEPDKAWVWAALEPEEQVGTFVIEPLPAVYGANPPSLPLSKTHSAYLMS